MNAFVHAGGIFICSISSREGILHSLHELLHLDFPFRNVCPCCEDDKTLHFQPGKGRGPGLLRPGVTYYVPVMYLRKALSDSANGSGGDAIEE